MSPPRRRAESGRTRAPAGPPIGPDTVVTIVYRLFDAAGMLRDELPASRPLCYVHGYGQIIGGLEQGLEGCRAGDTRALRLEPDEAFGERVEEAVLRLDRGKLAGGTTVAVDDEVVVRAPDGTGCTYRVVAVQGDGIVVDLNHPLAGQRVRFEVRVLAVRAAREREIAAAQRDAHERIVRHGAIVYGCGATGSDAATAQPRGGAAGRAGRQRRGRPPRGKGAT